MLAGWKRGAAMLTIATFPMLLSVPAQAGEPPSHERIALGTLGVETWLTRFAYAVGLTRVIA